MNRGREGKMEKGSNQALYMLSLVVLLVSAGHNLLQHTSTKECIYTRLCTYTQSNTSVSLFVCVLPSI